MKWWNAYPKTQVKPNSKEKYTVLFIIMHNYPLKTHPKQREESWTKGRRKRRRGKAWRLWKRCLSLCRGPNGSLCSPGYWVTQPAVSIRNGRKGLSSKPGLSCLDPFCHTIELHVYVWTAACYFYTIINFFMWLAKWVTLYPLYFPNWRYFTFFLDGW